VKQVLISTLGGNDTLVDQLPVALHPIRGITYIAGAGTADSLQVFTGSTDDVIDVGASGVDVTGGGVAGSVNADESLELMTIAAGDGADQINVSEDFAQVNVDAGAGNDTIQLSDEGTAIHGSFNGGEGDDVLSGGPGNDLLLGGPGNDTIHGNAGNDSLHGDDGNDSLFGDDGDDTLEGDYNYSGYGYGGYGYGSYPAPGGIDNLDGGQGNDTYRFAGDGDLGFDTITEIDSSLGYGGTDTLDFSSLGRGASVNLGSTGVQYVAPAVMLQLSTASSIENIRGSIYSDYLIGNGMVNEVWGDYGADTLRGGDGDDILHGGPDSDTDILYGEAGIDTLDGDFHDQLHQD
jgi:Ca2+-binding RTX toxin-like protein